MAVGPTEAGHERMAVGAAKAGQHERSARVARIDELMTQRPPADEINSHDPLLHAFQNHLSAIVGFCDLLLRDIPEGDPKRADILEVYKAGHAALDLLPQLSTRMR